jgi:hypothetical protein
MARTKPRAPRRGPEANVPGQLSFDGAAPWMPSTCTYWPPQPRGCGHCGHCDQCRDCDRCAGTGCTCDCEA